MQSSKYYLGDLITQRREKNPGGDYPIRGVSKNGLQPPKQIDADTSIYNLYYRKDFVFNPARMELGSIAFNDEYDMAICSSLYEVFYVHRTDLLLPEYLSLFVKHPEFARYCNYLGNGSAREYCRFDDISGISINLPPLEKQEKIVNDYKTISNRIKLLQRINETYFSVIETVFKAWIIDRIFVDETKGTDTSPYGDIPAGWHYAYLGDLCTLVTKGTTPTTFGIDFASSGINFIKGESINDDHSFNTSLFAYIDEDTDSLLKRSRIKEKDILFTIAGTLGKFAMADTFMLPANTNQAVAIIRVDEKKISADILYSYFVGGWQNEFYKRNIQQAVQANLSLETIKELPILLPDPESMMIYQSTVMPFLSAIWKYHKEMKSLQSMLDIIVSNYVFGG